MTLRIMTWNVNSLRLRLEHVERLIDEINPDVFCFQEIKLETSKFPDQALSALGYPYHAVRGMKSYNGVAITSRFPLEEPQERRLWCDKDDARHLSVRLQRDGKDPVFIENFYVPAGGDEPDPEKNEKFAHKLAFLKEMATAYDPNSPEKRVLVGDLNVAPLEHDVWSHKQLLKVVSHTPIEVDLFTKAQQAGQWQDALRALVPSEEKLYSWWSYRARDWRKSNRGRRLDHIWLSPSLQGHLKNGAIHDTARDWKPASDHAPVWVELDV